MGSKFWSALCLLLLAYNLKNLINDRYLVNYKIVEKDDEIHKNDSNNFKICTSFYNIKYRDLSNFVLKEKNLSVNYLLNYAKETIEKTLKKHFCEDKDLSDSSALKEMCDKEKYFIKINESYIFNNYFCILAKGEEFEKTHLFSRFLELYENFKIFIYTDGDLPYSYDYVYRKSDEFESVIIRIDKLKVYNEKWLVDSKDLNYQLQKDKFSCLEQCFRMLKIKRGLYKSDDNDTFDLIEIMNNGTGSGRQNFNISESLGLNESYKACFQQCRENNNFFWEIFNTNYIGVNYFFFYLKEKGTNKLNFKLSIKQAYYTMDDFYLQLFGLLLLFTGQSLVTLLPALLKMFFIKIKRHHRVYYRLMKIFNISYPKIKFAVTLFAFLFVWDQSFTMVKEHKVKYSNYPNYANFINFTNQEFSIVTCFEVNFKGKSFNKIVEESNDLYKKGIKSIRIHFGNKNLKFNWTISEKVIFKNITDIHTQYELSRCFRIEITPPINEPKFVTMLPIFSLEIKFKEAYKMKRELFLIDKNQNFESNLNRFDGGFYPMIRIKKNSKDSKKLNCSDYSVKIKCKTQRNCIDQCINEKYLKKHSKIPVHSVVDQDEYEPYLLEKIQFTTKIDEDIESKCLNDFIQPDCNKFYFDEGSRTTFFGDRSLFRIKLNFKREETKEISRSWDTTVLDIISIESIFFGTNATGLLFFILFSIKRIFKFKWYKSYNILIHVICWIGFLIHNKIILENIIRSELNENEFFAPSKNFSLPNPCICLEFNESKIKSKNFMLTGNYLNELTHDLIFEDIFDKIEYTNNTHWKTIRLNDLNKTIKEEFYNDSEIELKHFYFFGLKCFEIDLKIVFDKDNFYFSEDKFFLKIYLNKSVSEKYETISIFYKQNETEEINEPYSYQIGKYKNPYFDADYEDDEEQTGIRVYEISFEQFQIKRNDVFEHLKDLKSLFYEKTIDGEVKNYLHKMRDDFRRCCNMTTNEIFLEDDLDLEIENQMFEQFYLQIQNKSDSATVPSLNMEKKFETVFNEFSPGDHDEPEFSFTSSFLIRQLEISNSDNYTKLLIKILNTISLWHNACIIDFHHYLILALFYISKFIKLILLIPFNIKFPLRKLERFLYSKIVIRNPVQRTNDSV